MIVVLKITIFKHTKLERWQNNRYVCDVGVEQTIQVFERVDPAMEEVYCVIPTIQSINQQ